MTTISRISTSTEGIDGNSNSYPSPITADGRYIAFYSNASNLVAGDTNGLTDIFLKDIQTGSLTRISTSSAGVEGNGTSISPYVTADGRYVTFYSDASNLVAGDTNQAYDVFLKDTQTGTLTRVSTSSAGVEGNGLSGGTPTVSADGRYVLFQSSASNLVAGDTNGQVDIFLKDTQTGSMTRVSTSSDGSESNAHCTASSISVDGRYAVFTSMANNLVAGDTNGESDVFLKDLQTGSLTRISTPSSGLESAFGGTDPSMSADGRYVAFVSVDKTLVSGITSASTINGQNVFLKDTQTGVLTMISIPANNVAGPGFSNNPSVSADGRYVAFESDVSSRWSTTDNNLVNDIYVKDTQTGSLTRVSYTSGNSSSSGGYWPSVTSDGHVAFGSLGVNLIAGDTNNTYSNFGDIFFADPSGSAGVTPSTDPEPTSAVFMTNFAFDFSYFAAVDRYQGPDSVTSTAAQFSGNASVTKGGTKYNFIDVLGGTDISLTSKSGTITSYTQTVDGLGEASITGLNISVGDMASALNKGPGKTYALVFASNDSLTGSSYNDVLWSYTGNDTIDGGAGDDKMVGGSGDDIYYVDSTNDIVTEKAKGGSDTVISSAGSYTLGKEVENLTLGTNALTAIGNTGKNTITGNSSDNTIYGKLGNDTLTGGSGNDTFVFDAKPHKTANLDTITDFASGADKIVLEDKIFTKLIGDTDLSDNFEAIVTGGKATAINHFLLYDASTGSLYYDMDGSGRKAAVLVGVFDDGAGNYASLAGTDCMVV